MLTEDRCPRCEVERLKKLNEDLRAVAGIHGQKATVYVSYQWRKVLAPLLQILALPEREGEWNDPKVHIGKGSGSGDRAIKMPKDLAEKIAEIADEMDKEYVKALLQGYNDGLQIVSSSMGEVFDRMTKHRVKLDAKRLKKLFAKDKCYRGEFNIARDALQKELFAIFDKED